MARFVWRLDKVLNAKGKLEQAKEAEIHAVAAEIVRVDRQIGSIRSKLRVMGGKLGELGGAERLQKQQMYLSHAQYSEQEITQLGHKRGELEKIRQEKTAELAEIRRSIKVLEKLREKAKQEWTEEQEKIEQKETDDLNNTRSARRLAGEAV
ncbi:flagellar export protein FliJ [Anaerohalosphaera lusitana]|uniref:Flagellar export protein FliJ n=1 Tax=Anaerohalosphaera lusitana TaxID=1936003 RepID=A0A1U9NGM2_9BACT|nr:hypothetical protein [Anaerohalosphaera lusitana]AQT66898.1 flagellar export protein FliJ [Anaerohalosphaera lusitana]